MKIVTKARSKWEAFQGSLFQRKLNGWLAVIWLLAAIPICLFLSSSIPLLVFISVYAIVVSHWAGWQSGKIEVKADINDPNVDTTEIEKKINK